MKKIKIGCIGAGKRGSYMMRAILKYCENVEICAVCDLYEDRTEEAAKNVEEKTDKRPFSTLNADEIIELDDIEAVLIFSSWESHIDLAIKAMKHGKYVGVEVGGAYSLNDCFRLVQTYEETKVPCMLLENCCFGKTELTVLNMVRQGLFGEIVHCSGGYCHELREEIVGGIQDRHYRLRNYKSRNCENYPTHELGPIANVLNINRGNRMMMLSSFASKSISLEEYVKKNADKYPELEGMHFNQGDIVTTVITCADGSTITLTLDTTLPRAYSRGFTVRGTRGAYFEDNDSVFIDGEEHNKCHFSWKTQWGNAEEYRKKYNHPLWEKYGDKAREAGHDGMDYMVLKSFFESVEKKEIPPIDVYDMAAWMSITALSEESILKGGAPVAIPDFTNGKWAMYEKKDSNLIFALD